MGTAHLQREIGTALLDSTETGMQSEHNALKLSPRGWQRSHHNKPVNSTKSNYKINELPKRILSRHTTIGLPSCVRSTGRYLIRHRAYVNNMSYRNTQLHVFQLVPSYLVPIFGWCDGERMRDIQERHVPYSPWSPLVSGRLRFTMSMGCGRDITITPGDLIVVYNISFSSCTKIQLWALQKRHVIFVSFPNKERDRLLRHLKRLMKKSYVLVA